MSSQAPIQIKNRFTGAVLFEGDSGMLMRKTLEKATSAKSDLRGANLRGANLGGKKLVGDRPFFTIGPIGSRSDYMQAWITDSGLMICAGCFFDTRDQFELQLASTHGDNTHAQEYRAALVLIDRHAELWTPAVEVAAKEEAEVSI